MKSLGLWRMVRLVCDQNWLSRSSLVKLINNVYTILCSNGIPTTNPSVLKPDKATLIYKIGLSLKFNFGELVFRQVLNIEAWNDPKFLETFKKSVDKM